MGIQEGATQNTSLEKRQRMTHELCHAKTDTKEINASTSLSNIIVIAKTSPAVLNTDVWKRCEWVGGWVGEERLNALQ